MNHETGTREKLACRSKIEVKNCFTYKTAKIENFRSQLKEFLKTKHPGAPDLNQEVTDFLGAQFT